MIVVEADSFDPTLGLQLVTDRGDGVIVPAVIVPIALAQRDEVDPQLAKRMIEARWLYRQEAVRILEEPEIGCEGVFRADQRAQAIEDRAFGGVAAEHIVERL